MDGRTLFSVGSLLLGLPKELLFQILFLLRRADLYRVLFVCRQLSSIANQCLLENDANNHADALLWACLNGNTDLATRMLDLGASLDVRYRKKIPTHLLFGQSPLILAIYACQVKIVRLLIGRGDNVNKVPRYDVNEWNVIDVSPDPDRVQLHWQSAAFGKHGRFSDFYPIHWVVHAFLDQDPGVKVAEKNQIIDLLLDGGADVQQLTRHFLSDYQQKTPLLIALQDMGVSEEVVAYLLARGASITEPQQEVVSPRAFLSTWAYSGRYSPYRKNYTRYLKKLDLLMQRYDFYEKGCRYEDTSPVLIMLRSMQGLRSAFQVDMVKSALKHGFDVNTPFDHGQTILTYFAINEVRMRTSLRQINFDYLGDVMDHKDLLEIFTLLLDAGADPNGKPFNQPSINVTDDDQHSIPPTPTPVSIFMSYDERSPQISQYIDLFLRYGAVPPETATM